MAVETNNQNSNKTFFRYKQGYFLAKVDEADPRYSVKSFTNKDGEKEDVGGYFVNKISGYIENVYFKEHEHDGRKFETLNIEMSDGEVIGLTVGTRVYDRLSELLPSLGFSEEVEFKAYDLKDKKIDGISVKDEDGKKVSSHFYDFETKSEKNGAPKYEGDGSSDSWKVYFMQKAMYIKKYIKEKVVPQFEKNTAAASLDDF